MEFIGSVQQERNKTIHRQSVLSLRFHKAKSWLPLDLFSKTPGSFCSTRRPLCWDNVPFQWLFPHMHNNNPCQDYTEQEKEPQTTLECDSFIQFHVPRKGFQWKLPQLKGGRRNVKAIYLVGVCRKESQCSSNAALCSQQICILTHLLRQKSPYSIRVHGSCKLHSLTQDYYFLNKVLEDYDKGKNSKLMGPTERKWPLTTVCQ